MAQRIPRPSSAQPSNNHPPGPPSDLGGKVRDAGQTVLSILKDTDWPKEASNDVQDLIRNMEASPALQKSPKEGTETPEQLKIAIYELLRQLESAQTRLKGESEKYGTRKKGFRKTIKVLFSRNDDSQCAGVVRSCRNDIVANSTTVNDLLKGLKAENEQRFSRAAGDDSKEPQDTQATQTTSASNPPLNADTDLTATSVPSNSPPNQSAAQGDQVTNSKPGEQKGSSAKGEWLNAANMAFKVAEGVSGALPVVGSYVGAVAKVGLTVVEMVQTMEGNDEIAERLGNHVCRLSDVLERVRKHSRGSEKKSQIIEGMNELQQELQSVQQQIKELQAQRGVKKFWSANDNDGSLKNLQEQVRAALEEIQLLSNLNVSILVNELYNESVRTQQQRLLDRLGDGKYGAQGNLAEKVTCLPGTRVEILGRIDDWIRKAESSERVLWIRGMAGRGKSTIASTVAVNWERRAACAIFHFRRGQNKLDTRLVCSLSRQLGKGVDPELRSAILSSVRENQDIADQRLDEQFDALFVTPLSAVETKSFPILIIVDALDECDSAEYAVDFIKLIKSKSPSLPDNVKFLLTSRPEDSLIRALEPMRWRAESLDSEIEVDADIERFLHHGFAQIRDDHGIPEQWPSSATVAALVQMSQGLFQWAGTVIKYLGERSPTTRLAKILGAPETWSGVDGLYTQILSKAFEKLNASPPNRDLLLSVLGTVLAAPYPVSLEVIAFLHSNHEAVEGNGAQEVPTLLREEILADLNSLLLIPRSPTEPIQLMHTSIRDLLVDHKRCAGRPYWVNLVQDHQRLTGACLRQMNSHLRENICGLSDLSKPCSEVQDIVKRKLSRGIQYCCRSWSIHLTKGGLRLESDIVNSSFQQCDLIVFSEGKILYWLEVMSLVSASNEATLMAKQVHEWLTQQVNETFQSNSLIILWNDVQRFTTAFGEPIAFSPLHIYTSALAHCPVKTELWKRYGGHAKIRTIRGVQPLTWPSDLWTRAVGSAVISVAFSPNGALLASGCKDGTICLVDPQTGSQVGEPLRGHDGIVVSVCFSPDGKLLASGSSDSTIQLWDPQTGSQVDEPLTGHNDTVMSVCFSPDGKLLASGSEDKTIRLWDPQTGSQVGEPFTGHSDSLSSVRFSPDGKLLASGSDDNTIRLWDPQTRSQVGELLTSHREPVCFVCFSPDGKLLASGSDDNTIQLWDPQARSEVGEPLTGHSSTVLSACFSPDGKLLASGSEDETIRLWDPQTGSQVDGPLIGHGHIVLSVCFSPDGKLLASGSYDNTIRLWDPQTRSQVGEPLAGQSTCVYSICFSPDSKLLASSSEDNTIRLWDAQTGSQVGEPLTGHSRGVLSFCFSPDSKLLASGSYDNTIRLWDAQTGSQVVEALTGHRDTVFFVCFSQDGKLLASGSGDNTIRLWDPQTGSQVGEPLTGHGSTVVSACFSPDGKLLASGSSDGTIRLWDPQTGSQVGEPLTGHSDVLRSVCFSPDGKLLASGSDDNTIRLWNPQTGSQVCEPLTGHSDWVTSFWSSPYGKAITGCGLSGHSIAWDTFTCQNCDIPSSIPHGTPLDYKDHWVTFSSSRFMWLPSHYWGDTFPDVAVCEGKLAVACDKTVSIFDISDALTCYNPLYP